MSSTSTEAAPVGRIVHPAVERHDATRSAPPVVITCEHASNRLPEPWVWPEEDRRLVAMHWAWDPGIAEVARRLAQRLGVPAVLSRFSRLLVDPNRPLDSATLFRDVADDRPVRLNEHVDDADRARRLDGFYRPYHAACDAMVAQHPGAAVLGLHSFTDVYEGQRRDVQIGVLHDRDPDFGAAWMEALSGWGYDVRSNEPWSGLGGLMYAPQLHATRHGRRAVELELRQDLLADPAHLARMVEAIAHAAVVTAPA